MSMYHLCVEKFNWTLRDIDETEFETLFDFLSFKQKPNKNIKIIGNKEYHRATTVPAWL